ncbi:MAG: DUF3037 domain-containing protein [Saprospiraceae bacterium]|nr:DUF3037 domain-containing protein [Saprospiraceae bacterium]
MPGRETYEYAIIRLVPKVELGEFINIGVVLFSKSQAFLAMKYKIDEPRIASLSKEVDLDELSRYLCSWEQICAGDKDSGSVAALDVALRFRWLAAPKSTMLQCSSVHPGLGEDPHKLLEDLFRRFVV